MLYLKLKHKDKEIPFTVPTNCDEIPFKTFLEYQRRFEEKGYLSPIDIVSIYTNIDEDTWKKTNHVDVYTIVKATIDTINFSFKGEPETIKIKGKEYKVPKDLGYKSVGQFEDFGEHLRKMNIKTNYDMMKTFPFLIAVYFQPEIDGDYDYSKALELEKEIGDCSTSDVMKVASFFLRKYNESEKSIKGLMKLNTPTTK